MTELAGSGGFGAVPWRKLLFLVVPAFVSGNSTCASGASSYIWVEAENHTTATPGVRLEKSDRLSLTPAERASTDWFINRSGWDSEAGEQVSGGVYVHMPEGKRLASNTDLKERISYTVKIPEDGEYRMWIRCSSPPPCFYYFAMWLDAPEAPAEELIAPLNFSYWNVWSWWPWGYAANTGKSKSYTLKAGEHQLHIGNMNAGLKIDKILVTNDPDYAPYGSSQHFFNGTFESIELADYHNHYKARTSIPKLVGWETDPPSAWGIREEDLTNNHYLRADETTDTAARKAQTALIASSRYDMFKAQVTLLGPRDAGSADSMFLFEHVDELNYAMVRIAAGSAELVRVSGGEHKVLAQAKTDVLPGSSIRLNVHRGRSSLKLRLNDRDIFSLPMPLPAAGAVGVGSRTGGVGFDEIAVVRLSDPDAEFDFADVESPTLADWKVYNEGQLTPWATDRASTSAEELVLYDAPAWTNSEARFHSSTTAIEPFSILFPYVDSRNHIETRVEPATKGLQVFRHRQGQVELLRTGSLEPGSASRPLAIRCVKGLFTIFDGERKLAEANEYEILQGTIGIKWNAKRRNFPFRSLGVQRKNLLHDSFPLKATALPDSDWIVKDGTWKVQAGFEGQGSTSDGQLAALGAGTVWIGDDNWTATHMQVTANFDSGPEFSLLGWANPMGCMELLFRRDRLELRKLNGKDRIKVAETVVPSLSGGWHDVEYSLGKSGVTVTIDGTERMRAAAPQGQGRLGLRNYGEFAAFDNVTIQVISAADDAAGAPRQVDPKFVDIELDLLK